MSNRDDSRISAKLHPRLRLYANARPEVNSERAAQAAEMIPLSMPLSAGSPAPLESAASFAPSIRRREKISELDDVNLVNVFVQRHAESGHSSEQAGSSRRSGSMEVMTLSPREIARLASDPLVALIEPGEALRLPVTLRSSRSTGSGPGRRRSVAASDLHGNGAGVLIGIIDVGGFDFTHPDFIRADGSTRWHSIWDQGGTGRPAPGFGKCMFGSEITAGHMQAALAAARNLRVPAYRLEPQSQMQPGSHGTHVASIAAGNAGVAPQALIAGVLINLDRDNLTRHQSFYDSTCLANAVEYLLTIAGRLGMALSINVSLGTNGHAHDSSSAINRWIDYALSQPGRAVSVAAGNSGQEAPSADGDLGFIMGRIHSSGRIAAAGLDRDIELVVGGNGIVDGSENELEVWYEPQDRFAVSLRPPGSERWIGPVEPGEYIENLALPEKCLVSLYNELYYHANGCNLISVFLSPYFSSHAHVGIPSGVWTVRLHGRDVRDGNYHAWIERDDPRRFGPDGWFWPSSFSPASNVDNSSISSLACGLRVLGVANLDESAERINISSSQGPTRDGRHKPDVAAPGTNVIAANGFAAADSPWIAMTGTSMASPYVAGVAALMLSANPGLSAAQIEGIVRRTAQPLPGMDFSWSDSAGFGRINPEACIREAATAGTRQERKS
ncbi:S8 family serine peptidase [bacterium]|nr:S8 family serine peptidase [bacterium]